MPSGPDEPYSPFADGEPLAVPDFVRDRSHDADAEGYPAPPPGKRPPGYRRARPAGQPNFARRRLMVFGGAFLALLLVAILGYVGYVWVIVNGIQKSSILGNVGGKDINLLVMGLDSRLDENGKALPKDIYDALHAGDSNDGGLNSNVLMLVHVPADGSHATGFSIPRDDYVELAGSPDGVHKSKIKEAYGLAFDQKSRELSKQGIKGSAAYQQARDAGRKAEVTTVENFLGVKINRFVEVTMVAFFEIANTIGKVQVCLKEDTQDPTYSGAKFHAGLQWIDANQAVAFVRQRRDTNPALEFTDLDRGRRQQAFILSLLTQLKSASTLLDPTKITGIVGVAKSNVVISDGLDPIGLAGLAQQLSGGNIHFYTLPVLGFGTDPAGASINEVDPVAVKAMVASLINGPKGSSPSPSPSPSAPATAPAHSAAGITVNIVNAAGVNGGGKALLDRYAGMGYTRGVVQTASTHNATSQIRYSPSDQSAAEDFAKVVGGNVQLISDATQKAGHLTLFAGADVLTGPNAPSISAKASASASTPAPVDATGGGKAGPPPTALTDMQGGGVPCVK